MRKRKAVVFVLTLLWSAMGLSRAQADTISLAPLIDGQRTRNTATGAVVIDSNAATLIAQSFERGGNPFAPSDGETRQFALEFDLAALAGQSIAAATLSWREITDGAVSLQKHPIFVRAGDGAIDEADFSTLPASLAIVSDGNVGPNYELDVTTSLQGIVNEGNQYAAFTITNSGASISLPFLQTQWKIQVQPLEIHGRLASTLEYRPVLTIVTAVPEPASIMLLGAGLVGVFAVFQLNRRLTVAER